MITDLKIGEYVKSINTNKVYQVKLVDNYWDWFQVKLPSGKTKNYSTTNQFVRLTKEQVADHLLSLEKRGVTNYWREYD